MTDLTKIKTPFGLLDEDTQRALEECGGPWERFDECGWRKAYCRPAFLLTSTYRQAEKRETVTREAHVHNSLGLFGSGLGWIVCDGAPENEGEVAGREVTTLISGKPVRIVWTADGYEGGAE